MDNKELFKKIKKKNLENRVFRPGFFQSKQIVCEAINQDIKLTESVTAPGSNIFWVNDLNAYDADHTQSLHDEYFPKAFSQQADWAESIFHRLEQEIEKADDFIKQIKQTDWQEADAKQKIKAVENYVNILFEVQKYYVIAVPLTNYCEEELKGKDNSLLGYAVQYKELDVDKINKSLLEIKNAPEDKKDDLIEGHLDKFGWIKTNYNIVEKYTREDVLQEISSDIHLSKPKQIPDSPYKHLVKALQIGIYLRNRMKEVSQQIWFAYDVLAETLAGDFSISKDDLLQMHYKEVIKSLKKEKLTVSADEIKARHKGFIIGYLSDREVYATGQIVDQVLDYLTKVDTEGVTSIKGNTACPGLVQGRVKVVKNISEIKKLEKGDILVTSMTTPDFVIAMKKAGAIVTDEGGLSCHAAIVSRELGKPCVIGTEIATKVFKDDDLAEVDADKAIVKKLES